MCMCSEGEACVYVQCSLCVCAVRVKLVCMCSESEACVYVQ